MKKCMKKGRKGGRKEVRYDIETKKSSKIISEE